MTLTPVFIVLVAAGEGTRLGAGLRKAAVVVAGRPLVHHALAALADTPGAIGGALVVHPGDLERARAEWLPGGGLFPWEAVAGGETRAISSAAGLRRAPPAAELLVVHDAARPLLHAEDRDAVLAAARIAGAAILADPVSDTLKRVSGDRIAGEVDRRELWCAQTPQVFSRASYERALRRGAPAGTDEAEWLAAAGIEVRVVEARHPNPKVTRRADLEAIEPLLRARAAR